MKNETKRQIVKFLWKFLTALLAALGGAATVSSCYTVSIL